MPILEKKIQKKVIEYAKEQGFLTFKINVGSQRGWPDYLLIDPDGWHVWIEFKKSQEKPDPLQIYRAMQLTERNVAVAIVDNYETGKEHIDAMVTARLSEEGDQAVVVSGKRGPLS